MSKVPAPPHSVDYDHVRARLNGDLSASARANFEDSQVFYDRGGEPVWVGYVGVHGRDFAVRQKFDSIRIDGSPHKATLGESVGRHGPADLRDFLEDLACRMEVDVGLLLEAPLSRLDVAANLCLSRPAPEYVRLAGPPPRMTQRYRYPGSVAFANSARQLLLYDKVAKVRRTERKRNVSLLTPDMTGRNVLRAELRAERVRSEFKEPVTLDALCTPEFYREVAANWLVRFLSVPLDAAGFSLSPDEPFPRTVPALRNGLAAVGIAASGGVPAVVERIDHERAAGTLKPNPASKMRVWARDVSARHTPSPDAELVQELRKSMELAYFASSIQAVVTEQSRAILAGRQEQGV